MSVAPAAKERWTVEAYLEMERTSPEKHEFFDGEVFLMAGASYEHNLIVSGLGFALLGALRGKCQVIPSDMRLFIPATGQYTYADTSVLCGKPELTPENPPALCNPEMIFEVLSESTERYDRGSKFASYRTIPSLAHYVLISQDKILVEHFSRQADGGWLLHALRAGQKLRLPCAEILIDELYLQVSSLR